MESHSSKVEECVWAGVRGSSSFEKTGQEMCSNSAEIGTVFEPSINYALSVILDVRDRCKSYTGERFFHAWKLMIP